ncbi:MAG: D-2-hydroxyacid dehydrogenase [Thermomicrobiales bacterium]
MSAQFRALLGEDRLRPLASAHPRAEVVLADDSNQFAALLPRAEGVLIWPTMAPLLAPALGPGSRLRWVHSLVAGVEEMLTPALVTAEQVLLTASKGPMGPMMAEHALLLMLALARDLPGFVRDQTERRWRSLTDGRPMVDAFGKTVLIMGVGAVGSHLARMCKVGLRMRVLGTARTRRDDPHIDRYVERPDLPAALSEADFVVLCLALTPETERMIDAAALAAMKPSAYLVNVARGGLVDEAALVAALREGRIAGAGLDTTAVEPLPSESSLWGMPHVIITPHVSPGRDRFADEFVAFWSENIRRFAEGEQLRGTIDRHARY